MRNMARILVAGALIIGFFAPPSAASSLGSLVGGFATNKSALTVAQKMQLDRFVTAQGSFETANCTGYSSLNSSRIDLSRALARARAVCSYLEAKSVGLKISMTSLRSTNRNLIGKVQVTIKSSAPSAQAPSPSPTPVALPDDFSFAQVSLNECALAESANPTGAGSKGFPMRYGLNPTGQVGIAIIPVDFDNAVGVGNPGEMFRDDVAQISAWGSYFSRSKLEYKAVLASEAWLRAPKGADWYTCAECGKGTTAQKQSREAALQELVSLADSRVDFTNIDFVYFVFPHEAEEKFGTTIYARSTPVQTQEGTKSLYGYGEMGGAFLPASLIDRTKIWDHLIHELLHFQGLIGHGPLNGSALNIMTYQWGSAQSVTAWEGFMAGWFGNSELICLDAKKLDKAALVSLSSVDAFGDKPAAVMIRLSNEELIVVERRTSGPFTSLPNRDFNAENGFTAYRLNVNGESFRNDQDVAGTELRNFWAYIRDNGKIRIESSVSYKSVRVKVASSNQVEISRG